MSKKNHANYYVPAPSIWPIIGSGGLFFTAWGAVNWLHYAPHATFFLATGLLLLLVMLCGWFGTVIQESEQGYYNRQVDQSFRWGMMWFIFSEICFFAIFFAVLFYTRFYAIPAMGGEVSHHLLTHFLLWPDFQAHWPLLKNPDNQLFIGADAVINPWHIPALNTLILLTSGATITWAHWALKYNHRWQLILGMAVTVLLGWLFLYLQVEEYSIAYTDLNLTLHAGIYGATFYLLTGFHGLHVTIGSLMLFIILIRCMAGHFTPRRHFAFEATAWYWHFVDVIWLLLFICVYWL